MKRFVFLSILCVAALAYSALIAPASAQLVVNGEFQLSPDFTGWTLADPSGLSNVGHDGSFAYNPLINGSNYANLGTFGAFGSLSQAITTTPGVTYSLSFALANNGAAPTEFDVFWGGSQIFSLVDSAPSGVYTVYSFNNLLATDPSTTLQFRYLNADDFFRLDAVSMNVVPEISTTRFALIGFAGLGLVYFRRAKSRRSVSA